jgi:phage terminase large subunit-like protein
VARKISRGLRAIRWIEDYCRIPEGQFVGQKVKLRSWQKKVIRGIYDTPTRTAIISFGRKNAKTTLSGFLCLLHLVGPEARANSQLYSCAQSRDQAAILFNLMVKVIRQSPDLNAVIGVRESAKQLYCEELGTLYRALSAESTTAYGLSPVFVVHDELGQVSGPRFPLYDALETAAGAQESPLSVVISTQAAQDGDLLSVLIDDAKAGHDPETKLFLYTANESLDPFSEEAIKQANPAYGDFLNAKEVRRQADAAKRMPSQEAAYRNLILNQRVAREAPFISQSVWNSNAADPRPEDFEGRCVIGLDLSRRIDLTSLTMVGKGADGQWSVHQEFFAPKQGVRDRSISDRVPYDLWAEQGHLTLTPGNTVGYDFVAERIADLCEKHNVAQIQFDRWGIKELQTHLEHMGLDDLPLEPHGQGFKDMSPALAILEAELLNNRVRHGGNPILTWCAANAVVDEDAAGNRKLTKKRSTGRIDGMISLAMSLGAAVTLEQEASGMDDWLSHPVAI